MNNIRKNGNIDVLCMLFIKIFIIKLVWVNYFYIYLQMITINMA